MPMTPEVRAKWQEAWAEARRAKDARRQQNREKWAQRRDWSDDQSAVLPEVGDDLIEDAALPGTSDSLAKMRALMADSGTPLARRLDAAEVILSYELGPGAAAGVEPERIAVASYHFLRAAADAAETPEALRFRALKAIISVENARATARSSVKSEAQHREDIRLSVNAARRDALHAAGRWEYVVEHDLPWSITPTDTFDLLELPSLPLDLPADCGLGARLDARKQIPADVWSEHMAARNAVLLSVRASNRRDDWERFLVPIGGANDG
jgi:hypothetical protein